MTKLFVLQECKAIWTWLEKNPGQGKSMWPGWKTRIIYSLHCPCCEYARGKPCSVCPLVGYAWKEHCMDIDSPYNKWTTADTFKQKSRYAHKMVLACRRAIYALKGKI
jgi:hypothetical protein